VAKFRKKPVVIEAEQFGGDKTLADAERMGLLFDETGHLCGKRGWFVPTLEGNHQVSFGDWVITGVKGEKYPCKPDIFAMTYDPVETD
jgi:hypothetical protein